MQTTHLSPPKVHQSESLTICNMGGLWASGPGQRFRTFLQILATVPKDCQGRFIYKSGCCRTRRTQTGNKLQSSVSTLCKRELPSCAVSSVSSPQPRS